MAEAQKGITEEMVQDTEYNDNNADPVSDVITNETPISSEGNNVQEHQDNKGELEASALLTEEEQQNLVNYYMQFYNVPSEKTSEVEDYVKNLTSDEIDDYVLNNPTLFSTERLQDTLNEADDLSLHTQVIMDLLSRGEQEFINRTISQLSQEQQQGLQRIIQELRNRGYEYKLSPEEEIVKLKDEYRSIDLEDYVRQKAETFPTNLQMAEEQRNMVFHGTKAGFVDSMSEGFFTTRPDYKVMTKSVDAALNYKSGLTMQNVSDGTVTIWSPPRDSLGEGDRVDYSIVNEKPEGIIVPDSVPKPKNSAAAEYKYYIPGENLLSVIHLSQDQIDYIDDIDQLLASLKADMTEQQLADLVENIISNFPERIEVVIKRNGDSSQAELVKAMVVHMLESRLKKISHVAESGKEEDIQLLRNLPTFNIQAYESYKADKLAKALQIKEKLDNQNKE